MSTTECSMSPKSELKFLREVFKVELPRLKSENAALREQIKEADKLIDLYDEFRAKQVRYDMYLSEDPDAQKVIECLRGCIEDIQGVHSVHAWGLELTIEMIEARVGQLTQAQARIAQLEAVAEAAKVFCHVYDGMLHDPTADYEAMKQLLREASDGK